VGLNSAAVSDRDPTRSRAASQKGMTGVERRQFLPVRHPSFLPLRYRDENRRQFIRPTSGFFQVAFFIPIRGVEVAPTDSGLRGYSGPLL